jgi:hypothetical protein
LKSCFQYIENRISTFLLWLYPEFDRIEICFPLSALSDCDKIRSFQLFDELIYPPDAHTDILGQPRLAGEAFLIVPSVAEKHGVNHLRADAELWVFKNEVGNLGEATLNNRIDSVQLDVFLPFGCFSPLMYR